MSTSQYFSETMVVFTTTVSGIIKTERNLCWRNCSPIRRRSTSANRLCVRITHRISPTTVSAPFQQQLQQFSSRFHPKTIFYRELIEEAKGCSLQPLCDMFRLRLDQCFSALFLIDLHSLISQAEVPFIDIKPQKCSFKPIIPDIIMRYH